VSLREYSVGRDHFKLDARDGGEPRFASETAWPCCCCRNSEHTDDEFPCKVCDHNVNAVLDDPGKSYTAERGER